MPGEVEGGEGADEGTPEEDLEQKQLEESEAYLDELQERYGGPDPAQETDEGAAEPSEEPTELSEPSPAETPDSQPTSENAGGDDFEAYAEELSQKYAGEEGEGPPEEGETKGESASQDGEGPAREEDSGDSGGPEREPKEPEDLRDTEATVSKPNEGADRSVEGQTQGNEAEGTGQQQDPNDPALEADTSAPADATEAVQTIPEAGDIDRSPGEALQPDSDSQAPAAEPLADSQAAAGNTEAPNEMDQPTPTVVDGQSPELTAAIAGAGTQEDGVAIGKAGTPESNEEPDLDTATPELRGSNPGHPVELEAPAQLATEERETKSGGVAEPATDDLEGPLGRKQQVSDENDSERVQVELPQATANHNSQEPADLHWARDTGDASETEVALVPSPQDSPGEVRAAEAQTFPQHQDPSRQERAEPVEQPLTVMEVKAYGYQIPGREPDVRFDIRSESLQQRSGVEMEDGKVYEIKGSIGDVCEFTKTHREEEGNHVIVMVPREHRDEVKAGERYDIRVDSIEERRTFRAQETQEGRVSLNFQPTALESLGYHKSESDAKSQPILEFRINNMSQPSEGPITVFTQLQPRDNSANLSMTKLGARGGDEFEVLGVRERDLPSFVREFNASPKPEELRNVSLELANSRLSLDIDGHKFPFADNSLSTRNLELVLRTDLELSKREVRFWYDGQSYKPRLDDCKILAFKASDHGMKLVYEGSQHRISTVSSELYVEKVSHRPIENSTVKEISSNLKILSNPEGAPGDYAFEANSALHEYVHSRLEGLSGTSYNKAKGEIGEDICPAVLAHTDWEEIKRYPLDLTRNQGAAVGRGPDSLMCFKPESKQVLFEFKWRRDQGQALVDAQEEISRPKVRNMVSDNIAGGYIGILDWELGNKRGVLHVSEAWGRG